MKYALCFIPIFFFCLGMNAQDQMEEIGNTLFLKKDYTEALPIYKKLFEQEPDNIDYNYRLSCDQNKWKICYGTHPRELHY